MKTMKSFRIAGCVFSMAAMMTMSLSLHAAIPGLDQGGVIDLYAKEAQIITPDGDSLRIWGFATSAGGKAQYPGPTLIFHEGTPVEITLHNVGVPQPVSLLFPGQQGITKTCDPACADVSLDGNNVVGTGFKDSITYEFTASKPGTYMYQSGVRPQVQMDMGLVGALIVRPSGAIPANAYVKTAAGGVAYNNPLTGLPDPTAAYDREYMIFQTEMDPRLNYLMEDNAFDQWDNTSYKPKLWFQNGRNFPDTLAADGFPTLPHQPYGNLMLMWPGERVLVRFLNASRSQHPFHPHGNNYRQISRDGNLLMSGDEPGPIGDYTLNMFPGSTADIIWEWTGKRSGWDIFNEANGHTFTDDIDNRTGVASLNLNPETGVIDGGDGHEDTSWEWYADHGKPIPVVIPENQDLGFGGLYDGNPYLGETGTVPIGEGGLNPGGLYSHIWHSHKEFELSNNDIFPGGAITIMLIVPH